VRGIGILGSWTSDLRSAKKFSLSVTRVAYRGSKWVEELRDHGSYETMPEDKTSRLPPGYRLDLVGDPCIIILRGPDAVLS
jgi:hypothetical protein